MDIRLFDNYEDDGQLSMFDLGEDLEELQKRGEEETASKVQETAQASGTQSSNTNIRIQKCSSCGKILFVKVTEGNYMSYCNACGVRYWQKM